MQTNSAKQSEPSQNNYQPSVPISLYKELAAELQSAQHKVTSLQLQNEHLLKTNQTLIREFTKEFEAIAISSQQLLQLLKTLSVDTQEQLSPQLEIKPQEIKPLEEPKLQDFTPPPSVVNHLVEPVAKSKAVNYLQVSTPHVQGNKAQESKPQGNKPRPNNNSSSNSNSAKVDRVDLPRKSQESVVKPKQANVSSPQTKKQAVTRVVADAKPPTSSPASSSPASKLKTHQEEPSNLNNLESTSDEGSINGWWLALTILLIVVTSFGAGYFLMRPLVKSK
ncbi:hypothetical protein [Pseudanabaena sp. PCC 6802]|uniref:hypothetical protein n=1 Tax=Pseudanabaena sp. PCC 6802 TaxID=118173 RepID=UPI000349918D|nr:hypothetical protein [Pseudanabaena sp. PCC 6802]